MQDLHFLLPGLAILRRYLIKRVFFESGGVQPEAVHTQRHGEEKTAENAAQLYRLEGEPATNRSIPFGDVDMGSYYANAVSWAKQNGIVMGVTENEFAPDANITREQIAAIMFRYAVIKGMNAVTMEENLHFDDAEEISEYSISALNWAVGTGLIKGRSENILAPKENATRAEIAAILHRFIESYK